MLSTDRRTKLPASTRILKTLADPTVKEAAQLRAQMEALTAENRALRERLKETAAIEKESDALRAEVEAAQAIQAELEKLRELEADMLALAEKHFPVE